MDEDAAEGIEESDAESILHPKQVRQRDSKLDWLNSKMEANPTENNVYALVDELRDRHKIDRIFT